MWRQTVQSQRGFQSSPSDSADEVRLRPATIPAEAKAGDKGSKVGKGYETVAGIQVVDHNGERVAFGADFFDRGGPENHAERKIVRGLERHGPAAVPDGRLIVVIEKDCCPSCEKALREYAVKTGLTEIEIHAPVRESLRQEGKMVIHKTAARTSFMDINKPTKIEKLRAISIRRGSNSDTPSMLMAHTAIVGTIANLTGGLLLGIVQSTMKEEMLKSLENIPKPQVDRGAASSFFADPNTAKAIRVIDLMTGNLKPFGRELDERHVKIVAGSKLEVELMAISSLSINERLQFLSGLEDQLNIYEDQLNIVSDNLEAANDLSAKVIESAEGAEKFGQSCGTRGDCRLVTEARFPF